MLYFLLRFVLLNKTCSISQKNNSPVLCFQMGSNSVALPHKTRSISLLCPLQKHLAMFLNAELNLSPFFIQLRLGVTSPKLLQLRIKCHIIDETQHEIVPGRSFLSPAFLGLMSKGYFLIIKQTFKGFKGKMVKWLKTQIQPDGTQGYFTHLITICVFHQSVSLKSYLCAARSGYIQPK